jgi:8-oxo-dGTP diphosphatase
MATLSKKPLQVVVGLIINPQGQLLIAQRTKGDYAGLWEFPGGKVEINETPLDALIREMDEELGIHVTHAEPFTQLNYSYSEKTVFLDVWKILQYKNEAYGKEGQAVDWISKQEVSQRKFLAGAYPIIEKVFDYIPACFLGNSGVASP